MTTTIATMVRSCPPLNKADQQGRYLARIHRLEPRTAPVVLAFTIAEPERLGGLEIAVLDN